MFQRLRLVGAPLLVLSLVLAHPRVALGLGSFVTFESGQVRPLAMTPSGHKLLAVNTPDNRLEIFDVGPSGLQHTGSVPVGLEPVAVAAFSQSEVWVVNHLSDSVSIVDLASVPPRVKRTLLVGDEPRDIVFAGPARAFITTAHRGQNAGDPQLTTPGAGRADVWVFDGLNPGSSLGGDPVAVLTLFGDTPRALAVSPDKSTVYAAIFHSGNRTTVVGEGAVCDGGASAGACGLDGVNVSGGLPGGQVPGGLPAPNANIPDGAAAPEVGLIVRFDPTSGKWEDELGRNWNNAVRFDLPDLDVFAIDANATPPVETASFSHVGTLLFNMAVNPVSGKVYVSNTEARNEVRFEGPGGGGSTVRGHLHEARVTVLDGASVNPRHLNKHIDYSAVPVPAGVKAKSLATPVGMGVSNDGTTLYVAAFGSSKIGVFDTTQLENDSFVPDSANHIALSGGGPSGLVLDEANGRLYALTRFDNSISVVDIATKTEQAHLGLHNPEPPSVVNGRPFLYDADFTSSNGEASCSSCHAFGDLDSLGWDLGDPDASVQSNPNPFPVVGPGNPSFHPMKGPMTTQTLRGMANHGPMHWRGDRTGGNAVPAGSPLDEDLAFKAFNVAFGGLIGRDAGPIPDPDMQAFTDFILQVTLPPNPIRSLDNSLTAGQQSARNFFFGPISDIVANCDGCHALDPGQGFFGGDGGSSLEGETQEFKVAHLRNAYQKVGMFGMPDSAPVFGGIINLPGENDPTGDQIRGFGFFHDGSFDTLLRFFRNAPFNFPSDPADPPGGASGDKRRRDMEQFVLAFDTTLAPIVGQQVTLSSSNAGVAGPRVTLLIQRASAAFTLVDHPGATECDLIAKASVGGEQRGYLYNGSVFLSDKAGDGPFSDAQLRSLANTAGQELTYTCVPPGSGTRVGIDRDEDSVLDADDNCPILANLDQLDGDGDGVGDACDSATCGDGDLDPGEGCDDGNTSAGDCCSPTCVIDVDFTPCSDGNPCTNPDVCAAGLCSPGACQVGAACGAMCSVNLECAQPGGVCMCVVP